MPILFDFDEVTGVTQYFDYDPAKDEYAITSVQNLDSFFERLQKKRNDPEQWAKGVKEEWAHYASIPPVIEMQMRKKGIDIHNPHQTKEILKEINTNYPFLKATTAHHG